MSENKFTNPRDSATNCTTRLKAKQPRQIFLASFIDHLGSISELRLMHLFLTACLASRVSMYLSIHLPHQSYSIWIILCIFHAFGLFRPLFPSLLPVFNDLQHVALGLQDILKVKFCALYLPYSAQFLLNFRALSPHSHNACFKLRGSWPTACYTSWAWPNSQGILLSILLIMIF